MSNTKSQVGLIPYLWEEPVNDLGLNVAEPVTGLSGPVCHDEFEFVAILVGPSG